MKAVTNPAPPDLITWLKSRNEDLTARIPKILTASKAIAEAQHSGKETGAGSIHYDAVYANVNRLVPPQKLEYWRPIEAFVMVCAVFLHDIGRCRPSAEGKHHALVGKEMVIELADKLGLSQPEARAIGELIHAHGPVDLKSIPEKVGIAPHGNVRLQYLGAILQLADDLESDNLRADSVVRAVLQPDDIIVGKWDFRECIDYINIDPQTWTIEIQVTKATDKQWQDLKNCFDGCNKRLSLAKRYLRATPDIGLYYQAIDFPTRDEGAGATPPATQAAGSQCPDLDSFPLPPIAACVVLNPDATSQQHYSEVLAPCLKTAGFSPVQVEDFPPTGPFIERLQRVIKHSRLVLCDITEDASHLVHFRLGVAVGLQTNVLLYSRSSPDTVGDLSGTEVIHYETLEQLQATLTDRLRNLAALANVK